MKKEKIKEIKELIGKWERLVEEIEVLNDFNGKFYIKNSTGRFNIPYTSNILITLDKDDIKIILDKKIKQLKELEEKLENLINFKDSWEDLEAIKKHKVRLRKINELKKNIQVGEGLYITIGGENEQ